MLPELRGVKNPGGPGAFGTHVSSGVLGEKRIPQKGQPGTEAAIGDSGTRIYTHLYVCMYVCVYVCMCVCL